MQALLLLLLLLMGRARLCDLERTINALCGSYVYARRINVLFAFSFTFVNLSPFCFFSLQVVTYVRGWG